MSWRSVCIGGKGRRCALGGLLGRIKYAGGALLAPLALVGERTGDSAGGIALSFAAGGRGCV